MSPSSNGDSPLSASGGLYPRRPPPARRDPSPFHPRDFGIEIPSPQLVAGTNGANPLKSPTSIKTAPDTELQPGGHPRLGPEGAESVSIIRAAAGAWPQRHSEAHGRRQYQPPEEKGHGQRGRLSQEASHHSRRNSPSSPPMPILSPPIFKLCPRPPPPLPGHLLDSGCSARFAAPENRDATERNQSASCAANWVQNASTGSLVSSSMRATS